MLLLLNRRNTTWLLAGALFIGLVGGVCAAEPGCQLVAADPVVDFGAMRPSAGPGSDRIQPSPMRRTFSATCPSPTQMSVVFRGAAAEQDTLRWGERGVYRIRIVRAQLDGAPVQIARLPMPGQPPAQPAVGELSLLPSDTFAPAAGQQLLQGKRLDVTFEIAPTIPADAVRIAEQVKLDAVAQLELVPR